LVSRFKRADRPRQDVPDINERLTRFPTVRLINSDGSNLGVMDSRDALQVAREQELDMVLVSPDANPPVCRVQDYGKFKYEKEKRAREAKKNQMQVEVKELKFSYQIADHDYQVRLRAARTFLTKGDRVKCTLRFKGREAQHAAIAEQLLTRFAKDLEDLGQVTQRPMQEGRLMIQIISPLGKKS
jgi:translation initiation factor IF-3